MGMDRAYMDQKWPCMVGGWAGNNWLISDYGLYAFQFPNYGGNVPWYGAYLL